MKRTTLFCLLSAAFGVLAATGQAKIVGDDPLGLEVIPLGSEFGSPLPYGGRYPFITRQAR